MIAALIFSAALTQDSWRDVPVATPPMTDAQIVGSLIADGDCNGAIRAALRSGQIELARSARDYCDTDQAPWRFDPVVSDAAAADLTAGFSTADEAADAAWAASDQEAARKADREAEAGDAAACRADQRYCRPRQPQR